MSEMHQFRAMSAELGSNAQHVQGPGGNTSLKYSSRSMWVKASGFELSDALAQDIFADVDFEHVRHSLNSGHSDPLAGAWSGNGLKPSIETALHALMPHRVVVHTHSVPLVAISCQRRARELLEIAFADLPWAYVPYARPGLPLAQAVETALAERPHSSVLVLENHGVVVGSDNVERAKALLEMVVERIAVPVRASDDPSGPPDFQALDDLAKKHGLQLPALSHVHELALSSVSSSIALGGTLYPDHVVFLGPKVGLLDDRDSTSQRPTHATKLWLVPSVGILMEPALPKAAQAMAGCLADVVRRLPSADACRYLSALDEAELLGMDEEKYRQQLARERGSS